MDRIITYNFNENFIENLAGFIRQNFPKKDRDFSRIACVFGGRRPALFLKRALSKKLKEPFYPPQLFSIDEFVDYTVSTGSPLSKISELDACYLIYSLAKKLFPEILSGRRGLSEFLPWAQEIISFIEQLDLENIKGDSLLHIEKSASIGYDVPSNINILLQNLSSIRDAYHEELKNRGLFSRGLLYLQAPEQASKKTFEEFEVIIFCNFFYLHKTELSLMQEIYAKGKGILIFQGSEKQWPVLKEHSSNFKAPLVSKETKAEELDIFLYAGFDMHSQVCAVREILKGIKDKDNTVIVMPRPEAIVPLLNEISSLIDEFNVSMGYPLRYSSLYTLFSALFKAQENKKGKTYYAHDYLDVLRHPLIKNIKLSKEAAVTRILVHKIEEVLTGKLETDLGGTLFPSLEAIEELQDLYSFSRDTLRNTDIEADDAELRFVIKELHRLFFKSWEEIKDFSGFAKALGDILTTLVEKSPISSFAFNLKAVEMVFLVIEELEALSFNREPFALADMISIFLQKIEAALIAFTGSPLRGLQILGLFETRSLNFENVVIMDVNESALPKLKIYEPLIPREVMLSLGLNRLEKEEEIQRYQFMRLVSSAKNVHLVYEENQIKEKSRFIEELLWLRQKKLKKIEVFSVPKVNFKLTLEQPKISIVKTAPMLTYLKKATYSASRINVYLNCPLQFYYRYVLGFSESEDLLDEPQAQDVGNFIHGLLEENFQSFIGKKPLIDKNFRQIFWRNFEERFSSTLAKRMRSDSILLKGIIRNRLEKFLDLEANRNVEKLICLEKEFRGTANLCGLGINFKTQVDRIDEYADKSMVIIDYKTGGADIAPEKLSKIETMPLDLDSIRETIKSFQLPLYYYFISKEFPQNPINAELYSLRNLERRPFIVKEDYPQREKLLELCMKALEAVLAEIFDPNMPFIPKGNARTCEFCSFGALCK